MILRKSDEAMASSASVVATAMAVRGAVRRVEKVGRQGEGTTAITLILTHGPLCNLTSYDGLGIIRERGERYYNCTHCTYMGLFAHTLLFSKVPLL